MSLPLSVVIPTFNRRETLRTVLPLLASQTLPPDQYEILLCDSGSTDGTVELVAELAIPNLRFLPLSENRGRPGARNAGIRAAAGEKVLFTDADILPNPGLLEEHLRMHRERPHSAVVGMEVRVDDLEEYRRVKDAPHERGRHLHGRRDKRMSWLFFLTGNASVDRQALLDAGMFDENFVNYGHEDLELGYRLEQAGYGIWFDHRAVCYHWHPVRLETRCANKVHSGAATRRFYEKHRDRSILLKLGVNPFTLALHSLVCAVPAWRAKLRSQSLREGLGKELTLQYFYLCGYRGVEP